MSSPDSLKPMEDASLKRTSELSTAIREAIRRSLPTPREQFLTVMIPGKVVNFDDYKVDAGDVLLPLKVELNQAILCDDMPPLSTIQSGPTGRSVARTYANAISKLVASGSTVGIDEGATKSAGQQRYEKAMALLSTQVGGKNKSIVEIYTEKQTIYTDAVDRKTKAFHEALKRAQEDHRNTTPRKVQEAYDSWVQENARTYRNHIQAAYMDWVITGRKEEVEYWFAVVDQDTVLARVELSKEAMRLAVVQDEDGTTEYQTVKLEPSDWANKCVQKMKLGTNQTMSAEWYTWEINRLEKTNQMLGILEASANSATGAAVADPAKSAEKEAAKAKLRGAMEKFLEAKKAYNEGDKEKNKDLLPSYRTAQSNLSAAQVEYDKLNLASLTDENKTVRGELLKKISGKDGLANAQVKANDALIEDYKKKRLTLVESGKSTGSATFNAMADELGISPAQSNPNTNTSGPENSKPLEDYFTPITVEVSASSDTKKSDSSATTAHAEVAASGFFWHASASADLSEAHDEAQNELVNSSVKVSFECMRVDIRRSWMRPELFQDPDLVPGHGLKISPGYDQLNDLLLKNTQLPTPKADTSQQGIFPMYPVVAFMVACNVVLEISGSTSSLQTYMNNSSKAADASLELGPITANVHGGTTTSSTSAVCKATDSGCRIEIKSPQIIGWISQMVPQLEAVASQPTSK
ncbi:hypothetical protein FRC12_013304 [Ceratobasidium sp. 428]|nr:hypothetical protein FRC12_013304 [Ceratobasidium sp. 428]